MNKIKLISLRFHYYCFSNIILILDLFVWIFFDFVSTNLTFIFGIEVITTWKREKNKSNSSNN